jgi:hypothetical protein
MALVVVIDPGLDDNGEELGTYALYVSDEQALVAVSNPEQPFGLHRLFFTVPIAILREPGVGLGQE